MKSKNWILGAIAAAQFGLALPAAEPEQTLENWQTWPSPAARLNGATAQLGRDGWLEVQVQKGPGQAGVMLRPQSGAWNLGARAEIAVPVRNLGTRNLRIVLRVDDDRTKDLPTVQNAGGVFEALVPPAPDPIWLVVPLGGAQPSPLAERFLSMVGKPTDLVRRGTIHGAKVTAISLFVPNPASAQAFAVGPLVARGTPAPWSDWPAARVFPFVDEYGQFKHRNWPGKIHTDADFGARRTREEAELAAHGRPANWSRYGGWATGPRLAATGYFRTEQHQGFWWLVDPEGYLFWSHGVVRVGTRIRVGSVYHGTPLPERESFMELPARTSPLGAYYGVQPQSTRGYYVGRDNHAVYDYLEANLHRKYGATWQTDYAAQAQRRLASWGLNTIANSSDPLIFNQRQTPYTAVVYSAPLGRSEFRIQGSTGIWGKLPDPFDPGWSELMRRTLRTELKEALNDPWCLGFFVDNELSWGDSARPAEVVLASPAEQPAKRRLIGWLQEKHTSIQALNQAWATQHASWDALLAATTLPDRKRPLVHADLEACSDRVLEAYFRGCREAVKAAAPKQLYLGARFMGNATGNRRLMEIASRYCDVISINRYRRDVADVSLPAGANRPIMIGEFHFAAIDSPLHPAGLVLVANHADRGRAYTTYVRSALQNPAIVGTHWFQFYDQPTSGRFDGENYQTGLLDIADMPYPETIAAVREMGAAMYPLRSSTAAGRTKTVSPTP